MENICANIRKYRETKGITQAELAEALGVTQKSVSKFENFPGTLKAETVLAIADVLGCTVSDLYGERGART